MTLPLYLAVTKEEFSAFVPHKEKFAWMACEFSQSDSGLSNLPPTTPPGSMVMISDAKPFRAHSADVIISQLRALDAESILLDFQHPYDEKLQHLAEQIAICLPCPVGVSHTYAKKLNCPVFLPPVPLNKTPKDYFSPWQGREIWLDTALDALEILVTPQGSRFTSLLSPTPGKPVFIDPKLHCCYHTSVSREAVRFTLYRTKETLGSLLASAEKYGVTRCIGLYQELYENSL